MSTVLDKPRVLIIARDAGPANSLARVAQILISDDRADVVIIGFDRATDIFKQHDFPSVKVENSGETPGVAQEILERENPQLVLTGTSMKPQLDGAFWSEARRRGISSVALLDHWSHYWQRFSDNMGQRFAYIPDVIAVMDDVAYQAMLGEGCPSRRLTVTGQPALDEFVGLTVQAEQELRIIGRRELNVSQKDLLIVFASEPQAKHYGSDENVPEFLGYTENDALGLVLESVRSIVDKLPRSIEVIVKLHPLEKAESLASVISRNRDLRIRTLPQFSAQKLIVGSDVVTGMTSIFLLQAALTGKHTISVQPSRKREDQFTEHFRELIDRADTVQDCQRALWEAINESHAERRRRRDIASKRGFDGTAGWRVANLIYQKLGQQVHPNQNTQKDPGI